MDSQQAKQMMSKKLHYQSLCKKTIKSQNAFIKLIEGDLDAWEIRLTIRLLQLQEAVKESVDVIAMTDPRGPDREFTIDEFRNYVEVMENSVLMKKWQRKFSKKLVMYYSYAHNINIENAVKYLHQIKELQHEGLEIITKAHEITPNFEITNQHNETFNGEMAYKSTLDSLMVDINCVETSFEALESFTLAKEVNKSTKKMKKRMKKNKKNKGKK